MRRLFFAGPKRIGAPCFKRPGLSRHLTTGDLSNRIQYNFRDESLGARALDHPIFGAAAATHSRLEYIGDAVVLLLLREALLERLPAASSRDLTPLNDKLACNDFLAELAEEIGLLDHIEMACAKAGISATSATMDGALADTFEAVIGAVYKDGGLTEARRVFSGVLGDVDKRLLQSTRHNVKQILQDAATQLNPNYRVQYVNRKISDTGREATFECVATLVEHDTGRVVLVLGTDSGPNTRIATQRAAAAALKNTQGDSAFGPERGSSVAALEGASPLAPTAQARKTAAVVSAKAHRRRKALKHLQREQGHHVRIVCRAIDGPKTSWESDALLVDLEGGASDTLIGTGSGPSDVAAMKSAVAAAVNIATQGGGHAESRTTASADNDTQVPAHSPQAAARDTGSADNDTQVRGSPQAAAREDAFLRLEVESSQLGLRDFKFVCRQLKDGSGSWECKVKLIRVANAKPLGSGSGSSECMSKLGATTAALLCVRALAAAQGSAGAVRHSSSSSPESPPAPLERLSELA